MEALVVVPKGTSKHRMTMIKEYGKTSVVQYGNHFEDALKHAIEIATETGKTFIHPFDDPLVIAGHGTIAMEILQQVIKWNS